VRVALVASPTDLGSVTALWRRPRSYARFLGQELALVYRGTLLVVMPSGFGVYRVGTGATGPGSGGRSPLASAIAGLGPPGSAAALAAAATGAIQRLASAAGHRLAAPAASPPGAAARNGGADVVAWLALAAGLAVIGAAWAASLRARPLRAPREQQ
jgi:hypothetical protein